MPPITLPIVLLLALLPCAVQADDAVLAQVFADAGAGGTLVIAPLRDGDELVHDAARAAQRFPVASTFKILNTLIALDAGVMHDDEVFHWDGVAREFPAWNQDQTLDSAFRLSCVWCYQELARRVGPERYRQQLTAIGYGALREPFPVTEFWLDGSLQASAQEQVELLRKIIRRELPFAPTAYDTLQRIMQVEHTPTYTLRAKTGWATQQTPGIGWYVGYIETAHGIWMFALNIDIRTPADLPQRQQLVLRALRAKQLIE